MSEKNINDIAALFDHSYWAIEWRAGSFHAGPIHVEKTAYEHESLLLFWNKWITDIGFRVEVDEDGLRVYEPD